MDLADRRSRVRLIVSALGIVVVLISLGLAAEYNRRANREGSTWAQRSASAPVYSYRVVGTYPHDRNAFSQGLDFDGETLFESTGQYGKSSVRRVNLETGQVEKWLRLDNRLFGEGLTLFDDKLAQITWKRGIGYVYDAKTLRLLRQFKYAGEGWGLTHDGTHFIMSDGSDRLKFRDPESFSVVRTVRVKDGRRPVRQLNELEFANGKILANVWHTDRIAIIEPETGKVSGWMDLSGLLAEPVGTESVLNGIAYEDGRLFVTGKNWPKLFEIQLKQK
ncbi:MAG: glutaminyl-peptide cyclotransferase [Planctomycetota bacterium]